MRSTDHMTYTEEERIMAAARAYAANVTALRTIGIDAHRAENRRIRRALGNDVLWERAKATAIGIMQRAGVL